MNWLYVARHVVMAIGIIFVVALALFFAVRLFLFEL
jgi:hypothetical protein